MRNSAAALADHVSIPESRTPSPICRLERPQPLVRATALAFLRFEKPDLDKTERFLTDFGLKLAKRTDTRLEMRGAGPSPAVLVATKGQASRFLGAAFVVPNETDFDTLEAEPGARRLNSQEIPNGAEGVELTDPAGHKLWLIRKWTEVEPLPVRPSLHETTNTPDRKVRVNATVRAPIAPAEIVRLGHMVLQVTDFPKMAAWYMRHLGLIPTDVQYLPDGSTGLTFFRLDLGDEPADHHTFVLVAGIEDKFEHSAYEVVDLDAVGQGQQVLRAAGHRHMWGIGRHILGSQIFDYWYDPDGVQFEHYADGDVFTADYEPRYSPFDLSSIWAWGEDAPPAMRGRKSPAMLWAVIRGLVSGRLKPAHLKQLGRATSAPSRPWL